MDDRKSRRLGKLDPEFDKEDLEKVEKTYRGVRRQERLESQNSARNLESQSETEESFLSAEGTPTLEKPTTLAQSALAVQALLNSANKNLTSTPTRNENVFDENDDILDQQLDALSAVNKFGEELESVSSGTQVAAAESLHNSSLYQEELQSFTRVIDGTDQVSVHDSTVVHLKEPTDLLPRLTCTTSGGVTDRVETELTMPDDGGNVASQLSIDYLNQRFADDFKNVPLTIRSRLQTLACDFDQLEVKLKTNITSLTKELNDAWDQVNKDNANYPILAPALKKLAEDVEKVWIKLDSTGDQALSTMTSVKTLLRKPDDIAGKLRDLINAARVSWHELLSEINLFQLQTDKYKEDQKASKEVLPKLKLETFTGKPDEFLSWKASIETHVLNKQIPEQDKAIIILNALDGPAKKAVQSYQTSNGPKDLMKQLEMQYGQADRLRSMYMSKLINMEKLPDDSFYVEIRKFLNYLSHINEIGKKVDLKIDPQMVNLLAMKLPKPFMREVLRQCHGGMHAITIEEFLQECNDQVEREQMLTPLRSQGPRQQSQNTPRRPNFQNGPRNYTPQWAAAGFQSAPLLPLPQSAPRNNPGMQPGRQRHPANQQSAPRPLMQPQRAQQNPRPQQNQRSAMPQNRPINFQPRNGPPQNIPERQPQFPYQCALCKERNKQNLFHREVQCPDFQMLNSGQRRSIARRLHLCFRCCSNTCRRGQFCKSRNARCNARKANSDLICGAPHHHLLCPGIPR